MSQITLFDGTTTVNVAQHATVELSQGYESLGGSTILRMLDGTGVKQTHWAAVKKKITVKGSGWTPPGLDSIDYSVPITLTVRSPSDATPDGPGTVHAVFCDPPTEDWDINKAAMSWTLTAEEV